MTALKTSRKRRVSGFYVLPEISILPRSILIIVLLSAGIMLQMIHILAGFILVLGGILLTLLKPVTNVPSYKKSEQGKWVNVTDQEFTRIREHYKRAKKWANNYFNLFTIKGNLFFLFLALPGVCVGYYLSRFSRSLVNIWVLDYGAFTALFFLTGERNPHQPKDLLLKIGEFMKIMEFLRERPDPDIVIQPMMEVKPAGKTKSVPTDARLFLKFRSAPVEFIGLQFQISLNRVGSRSYPYLYAVLLGRRGFDFKKRLSSSGASAIAKDLKKIFTLETKRTGDVDILVFRQTTTKTTGYHTSASKQREIVLQSLALAKSALREANADLEKNL